MTTSYRNVLFIPAADTKTGSSSSSFFEDWLVLEHARQVCMKLVENILANFFPLVRTVPHGTDMLPLCVHSLLAPGVSHAAGRSLSGRYLPHWFSWGGQVTPSPAEKAARRPLLPTHHLLLSLILLLLLRWPPLTTTHVQNITTHLH